MRNVKIELPSGKLKMTLWKGTEDEQDFPIRSMKRGRPYVNAYGKRYYLTEEEIDAAKQLLTFMD